MEWSTEDAETCFSELVEAALTQGPQIVTNDGVETVAIVSYDEWRSINSSRKPTLKKVLPRPRTSL